MNQLSTICLILSCITGIILFFILNNKEKELKLYKTIFPFGEVIDRLTILSIKKLMKNKEVPGNTLQLILPPQIENKLMKDGNLLAMTLRLMILNLTQWEMEDRVREEGSGEAALSARENNNLRTNVKNQITKMTGGIPEEKIYKGELDGKTN